MIIMQNGRIHKKISDVMCCIKLSKLYLKLTPPPNLGIMVKNAKFGFWNPPKKCSDFLIFDFFFIIRVGGRGSMQIRTFSLLKLFFLKASLIIAREN